MDMFGKRRMYSNGGGNFSGTVARVFGMERKVPAGTLALQRSSKYWHSERACKKCGKSESYLGGEANSPLYRRV